LSTNVAPAATLGLQPGRLRRCFAYGGFRTLVPCGFFVILALARLSTITGFGVLGRMAIIADQPLSRRLRA
jgi:hypothetical protein